MEAAGSTLARRIESPAGHTLTVVLVELGAALCRGIVRQLARAAERRRQARARRELRGLSDRFLRDIGLERSDIDRLFR